MENTTDWISKYLDSQLRSREIISSERDFLLRDGSKISVQPIALPPYGHQSPSSEGYSSEHSCLSGDSMTSGSTQSNSPPNNLYSESSPHNNLSFGSSPYNKLSFGSSSRNNLSIGSSDHSMHPLQENSLYHLLQDPSSISPRSNISTAMSTNSTISRPLKGGPMRAYGPEEMHRLEIDTSNSTSSNSEHLPQSQSKKFISRVFLFLISI